MQKGEMFKRIFTLLSQGKTATEIIDMGFPKATVYWSLNKYKKGEEPAAPKRAEPWWMTEYRQQGLTHDCEDGRVGTLEEDEIRTDEGIIFQKTCNTCGVIMSSRFERWTYDAKLRYQEIKGGRVVSLPPPPIAKRL